MKNLALIGMMGCGKSTLAKKLSQQTEAPLLEFDRSIEGRAQASVAQIFAAEGEQGFRLREEQLAAETLALEGHILDCGGGIVTRRQSMEALKKSSYIVFIERPLDQILSTIDRSTRPLAGDEASFTALYQSRLHLYKRWADAVVPNRNLKETLKKLIALREAL